MIHYTPQVRRNEQTNICLKWARTASMENESTQQLHISGDTNKQKTEVVIYRQIYLQMKIQTRQIWGIWKLRPAYSPEQPNLDQNRWCFVPCDLEILLNDLGKKGHLSFAVSSFVRHFIAIGEFKLELQSGNAQFGSNSTIFRAVWPWNLTYNLEKQ